MNYCPNCGYHLAAMQPKPNPITTFPPNSVFSTVSIPPIMGHWGGSPLNEQVSFITGKDYGTKTSTKG